MLSFTTGRSMQRMLVMSQAHGAKGCISRAFSLASNLKGKEKVEEDLYIRRQEQAFFDQKKAQLAESEHIAFKETIAPSMAQAAQILKATNDSVSTDGLEALAKWKTGL